jgi:hypothetical protein
MRFGALGTIIDWDDAPLTDNEYHSDILDYYDHWNSIDPAIADHHSFLSPAADRFGHCLVSAATYSNEILGWLSPTKMHLAPSVVVVSAMTEGMLYILRSACDCISSVAAHAGSRKSNQIPTTSLRKQIEWIGKNRTRVNPMIGGLFDRDFQWFWDLRTVRDALAHQNASAVIHCDNHQYNLWVYAPEKGWVTRRPLLPFLGDSIGNIVSFANEISVASNDILNIPKRRNKTRVVQGVLIPALHALSRFAPSYAKPSP